MDYVLGFVFFKNNVLLMLKQKPDWQKGLWNGIGGKIESNEPAIEAMRREAIEKIYIDYLDWKLMDTLYIDNVVLNVCFSISPNKFPDTAGETDIKKLSKEAYYWWDTNNLPSELVPLVDKFINMYKENEADCHQSQR